jgi:hypothetical protein
MGKAWPINRQRLNGLLIISNNFDIPKYRFESAHDILSWSFFEHVHPVFPSEP